MAVDTGIMSRVLNHCLDVFAGGGEALGAGAVGILSALIAIEITWAGLMWALGSGGEEVIRQYLKKVVHIGVFAFITLNFASLATIIMDGFIWAGVEIGGGSFSISMVRDPSKIIDMGFAATFSIWESITEIGILETGLLASLLMGFIGFIVLILYFIVALQIFMTLVEFYLITAFGVIMIPWGINKHTAFIAERYFGAILAQGVKLMVVVSLVGLLMPVLSGLTLGPEPSLTDGFSLMFGVATIGFLIWRAPSVASGLMSGSANLSASDTIGMGVESAGAAAAGGAAIASAGATGGASLPAAIPAAAAASGMPPALKPPKGGK